MAILVFSGCFADGKGGIAKTDEDKELFSVAEKYAKACNEENKIAIGQLSTEKTAKYTAEEKTRCNGFSSELVIAERAPAYSVLKIEEYDVAQGNNGDKIASVILEAKNPSADEKAFGGATKNVHFIKTANGWKHYIPLKRY
ncbi:MAG TPA: hypothetical protein PKW30_00900 [Campylobacterales bacterium]|nr:hypothetical protein [Campylobacterales bacterium]